MINNTKLKDGVFFKIGTTVSTGYHKLPAGLKAEWEYRFNRLKEWSDYDGTVGEEFYNNRATAYPEFGAITSIAVGFYILKDDEMTGEIETALFQEATEKQTLQLLADTLEQLSGFTLAGYNVINHDVPFIIKRMLLNDVKIPSLLKINGLKPWEVDIIDVMREYQGTTYEFIRLEAVCELFGVPVPKDGIEDELKATMQLAQVLAARLGA